MPSASATSLLGPEGPGTEDWLGLTALPHRVAERLVRAIQRSDQMAAWPEVAA